MQQSRFTCIHRKTVVRLYVFQNTCRPIFILNTYQSKTSCIEGAKLMIQQIFMGHRDS